MPLKNAREIGSMGWYREYNESAYMARLMNPNSQSSFEFFLWIPLTKEGGILDKVGMT
jgi:hypothetical protein